MRECCWQSLPSLILLLEARLSSRWGSGFCLSFQDCWGSHCFNLTAKLSNSCLCFCEGGLEGSSHNTRDSSLTVNRVKLLRCWHCDWLSKALPGSFWLWFRWSASHWGFFAEEGVDSGLNYRCSSFSRSSSS